MYINTCQFDITYISVQRVPAFASYPAFVRSREMEKILVQWSDGRSKGTTSLVRKTAVKTGTIAVGKKVVVCWGKSKKTYNAQVIRLSSAAPASPAATRNEPEDQFCFELADPAPSTADQRAPGQQEERFPTILKMLDSLSEKIDNLSDTLSGVEAQLVCRLRMLKEKVSALYTPRDYLPLPATPVPPPAIEVTTPQPPPTVEVATPQPPPTVEVATLRSSPTIEVATPQPPNLLHCQETLQTHQESPQPLSDITNETGLCIPVEDISSALQACRSRRNLAARLTAKMFSPQQRFGSNCRGVLGKKALNGPKVKAIYDACMQHFPLQRLESASASEKEMRNSKDEVCRKTKPPTVAGLENDTF